MLHTEHCGDAVSLQGDAFSLLCACRASVSGLGAVGQPAGLLASPSKWVLYGGCQVQRDGDTVIHVPWHMAQLMKLIAYAPPFCAGGLSVYHPDTTAQT